MVGTAMLDVEHARKDFPILARTVHGRPLVYLDNAATSQKPRQVIAAIAEYYEQHNANVRRGIHTLGDEATRLYEQARERVAAFIGAGDPREIVFVRNTTEGINLVAYAWGSVGVGRGDVILTTEMEHHSNLVPWQQLAKRSEARMEYVRVRRGGVLDMEDLERKLQQRPKLIAVSQVSNFLGTINPVERIIRMAHRVGAVVLVDGAQAVPHMPVDVRKLGADFYAFSGHKMLGPMGIGVLWVRRTILEGLPPFLTGGGTISEVHTWETRFADLPDRYDAGTPNVAGALGLTAAINYLTWLGMEKILAHEQRLVGVLLERLRALDFIRIHGPLKGKRGSLVAFEVEGVHAHDVAQVLDSLGIAVRSGHHCTMPMHEKLGIAATTRVSFALYNTEAEIERVVEGLHKVRDTFRLAR